MANGGEPSDHSPLDHSPLAIPHSPPAVRTFDDFLSADPTPRRVEFLMGKEACWIDLVPMDAEAADRFQTLGISYSLEGGVMKTSGEVDLTARNLFLVTYTLFDYLLVRHVPTREGGTQRYEIRPPEGDRQKSAWRGRVEQEVRRWFRKDRAFWHFVIDECRKENAEDEETAGNSSSSSDS